MRASSKLTVIYEDINLLKPYKHNAKIHTDEQVGQIKKSIKEFGFNDPIAVDEENVIIEGHGRLMAAKELGMKEVPVIFLYGLTDQQKKAYILAHNQLTMNTDFDMDVLADEINRITAFDMEDFGFDLSFLDEAENDDMDLTDPRSAAVRHNVFENQERRQFPSDNYYGIPNMEATSTASDKIIRFCDLNSVNDPENYIAHFYYDDFKFIQAWRDPDKYMEKLRRFKAVISPDFSLYTDFPRALQILSCYRRQWCGAYWQEQGIDVIPDVVWGDKESYDYCFLGIPKHSTVAVSTVGVKNDKEWNNKDGNLFLDGYNEMLKRLEPTTIILCGSEIEGLEGNIIRCPSFYELRRKELPNRRNKNG